MEERREQPRRHQAISSRINIGIPRSDGAMRTRQARLADISEWGIGFDCAMPMVVGASLFVWGDGVPGAPTADEKRAVRTVHCRVVDERTYRAGCSFSDEAPNEPRKTKPPAAVDSSFPDRYEVLQISPNADPETIHRVYRIMAQRYHPDNVDTGNQTAFQAVLEAYHVLSDPEKRAAYDAQYHAGRALRWKVFDKPESAQGLEAEKRKRAAVLTALYVKRRAEPDGQGMMVRELEELLGCPREHLGFTIWYLRRKEFLTRADNGRFDITVGGVDEAERIQQTDLAPRALQLPAGGEGPWTE